MHYNFFCDDLPHKQDIDADKKTKERREREREIKEECKKKLYEGEKASKVWVLLSLLNLQTIYN